MAKKLPMSLSDWEWLTIMGVVLGTGVAVTAYAFTQFETISAADKREGRLEKRLDRQEELIIATMKGLQIQVPPPKIDSTDSRKAQ